SSRDAPGAASFDRLKPAGFDPFVDGLPRNLELIRDFFYGVILVERHTIPPDFLAVDRRYCTQSIIECQQTTTDVNRNIGRGLRSSQPPGIIGNVPEPG